MDAKVALAHTEKLVTPDKSIFMPGEIGVTISWEVRKGIFDPKGEVTQFQPPRRSESFVKNFIALLRGAMESTHHFSAPVLQDTSGNTYPFPNNIYIFDVNSAINLDTRSIQVGIGNTAPTITDYALANKITHGVGAGQMQYGATTFGAPSAGATTSQFTVTRNFANGSGGAITVNEIGLVCTTYDTTYTNMTATPKFLLLIRDVIGGGIAVPNGETLTINYRPQAVV